MNTYRFLFLCINCVRDARKFFLTSSALQSTRFNTMASVSYNFTMEDQKPIFTPSSETPAMSTKSSEAFSSEGRTINSQPEAMFSPLTAQFQGLNFMTQQEPRVADTAPTAADIDLLNFQMHGSDFLFNDTDQTSAQNFYTGSNRTESVNSSHGNLWSDGTQGGVSASRNEEMIDTFEFLIKSLSSANNYVSMLTREQLSVLRLIRPGLLYEFLQEVARIRGDKRMRRALPNECAFCKNNGENEESYSSHALKDWRGRVLCPVLRDFRCPRCGATGDRAHTIKYCPENPDNDRTGLSGRRRMQPPSLVLNNLHSGMSPHSHSHSGGSSLPPAPTPSPSPASASLTNSNLWRTFMN